jgi:hypothetical protein
MKQLYFFLLAIFLTLTVSSQTFKKDDLVEVDPLLSDSPEGSWKQATVLDFDSTAKNYMVKLPDGNKMAIPSKTPEKWIRPVVNKQVLNKYGPGARIPYQKRDNVMKAIRCNPSEAGVKKNILSLMAGHYKDYPYISVEFTSFKGQHGYDDTKNKGQFVYPYKIEMLVHLKRTLQFGGRAYTEYQTWEFDRIYEYATGPGKKCDFYAVPSSDAKLVSRGWY